MQSSSSVSQLPFWKNLRKGQQAVLERLSFDCDYINVKCPTGYGKTIVNLTTYSALKRSGRVNRLLTIFPTDKQLTQFVADGPSDLKFSCVDGPRDVCDLRFFEVEALRRHERDETQVFAVTIQSLVAKGRNGDYSRLSGVLGRMLQKGNWMITFDEYHHYGIEKTWGTTALSLPCKFRLAMSATPYRPEADGAFGEPNVIVTYREAVEEGAVKPLLGHSYIYRIDIVNEKGEVKPCSTNDLICDAGSGKPDDIEKHMIKGKMRWSPKYISPLISHPIERMQKTRATTGHTRLQVLAGAICVSHAKMVCEQIRDMYPELTVDWVGTGDNGRSDDENRRILELFCPKKDANGRRNPTLDVLVHVGMAGEGLDSIHVTEVIHLNPASVSNSNNQENGRAARFLKGVKGHINFDSCSGYGEAGYVGAAIMDAMDNKDPQPDEDPTDPTDPPEPKKDGLFDEQPELQDEPTVHIYNMELENIDSGSPEVALYKQMLVKEQLIPGLTVDDLANPDHPIHRMAVLGYKNMRKVEAEQYNAQSAIEQLRDKVNAGVSRVTGLICKLQGMPSSKRDPKIIGEIKKKVNQQKKKLYGELSANEELLKDHYRWLARVEKDLCEKKEIPSWLK